MRTVELTLAVGEVVRVGEFLCTVVETAPGEVAVRVDRDPPVGEPAPPAHTPASPR